MAVAASAMGALWGAYAAYLTVADYFSPAAQEQRRIAAEHEKLRDEALKLAADEAERDAERADLEENRRVQRVNQAKFEADQYQWLVWKHTLQDIKENSERMKEKQRLADEEEAEKERLLRIEKEREARAAAKRAADMAAKLKRIPQKRVKKTFRSF